MDKTAIERDWTSKTLAVLVTNSQGETFYFEVPPEDDGKTISRKSDSPEKEHAVVAAIELPIARKE